MNAVQHCIAAKTASDDAITRVSTAIDLLRQALAATADIKTNATDDTDELMQELSS